jgi:glycosyltransferase involved in cell wall biosynthesis
MPSLNQAAYLGEAIESVLSQSYPALEFFVVDGGSIDGSVDIIRRHANRIDRWVSEPDGGQAWALAKGFSGASGDILCWLNSDDRLEPNALWRVARACSQHGAGAVFVGGCVEIRPDCPPLLHMPHFQDAFDKPCQIQLESILDLRNRWIRGDFFYQPEVFFPRQDYEEVGGIDASLHYAMDYDLWVRLILHGTPFVALPESLACFRFHKTQKTAQRFLSLRETVAVAERVLGCPRNHLPSTVRRRLRRSNRSVLSARFRLLRFVASSWLRVRNAVQSHF